MSTMYWRHATMVKHTLSPSDSTVGKRAVIWLAVSSERQAHEDKTSMEEQERLARKWCEENDYSVVRILKVDGYSRRESDVLSALEEFDNQGIYAYRDLRRMWQNKDFDVLVAYGHDRLGRSNTLHSFVVENVIKHGMSIYLIADGGFVTEDDFRMKMAFGGMMAATPVDKLIKAAAAAKDKLITQGLPTGATIPLSHRLIRDPESGKALYLELNPNYEQLFQDLATLLLEGVAYNLLSKELKRRFGHSKKDGKAYRHNMFYELLYTPTFWGHMARRYTSSSRNGTMRGAWAFDETVDPPTGVTVARNVIPARYEGELAQLVKAEIYRRMDIGGKRRPKDTYRFAGLFICGECGTGMGVRSKPDVGRTGLRCSVINARTIEKTCSQNYMTPHRYLQAEMENLLRQLVAGASPEIFTPRYEEENTEAEKLKSMKQRKEKLEAQILVLIGELSNAHETAQNLFRKQIENYSVELEIVADNLNKLERKLEEDDYISREEIRTLDELKSLTLDCFWRLPDREINQWLRRLMGRRKFVIQDRKLVDVAEMPAKKRNSGRKSIK